MYIYLSDSRINGEKKYEEIRIYVIKKKGEVSVQLKKINKIIYVIFQFSNK